MRLSALFVLLLGATSSLAQGQPQAQPGQSGTSSGASLTLVQAEATALRNNPQITIGKLRALEAQQYVRETRSALLPTAYLSLTGVDSEAGSRIAAGALNNPILFSRAAAGATVSQLVTDFGRTTNLVSSSQFQAKAQDKNAAATTADITLAVDQAFYNALESAPDAGRPRERVDASQTAIGPGLEFCECRSVAGQAAAARIPE